MKKANDDEIEKLIDFLFLKQQTKAIKLLYPDINEKQVKEYSINLKIKYDEIERQKLK